MEKINNVISIQSSIEGRFFRYWLEFLKPFHKLTEREIDVLAAFLKYRYELSKVISDPKLLNDLIMSKDTKRKIREDCGISHVHFYSIMDKFKKLKVIDNDRINPKFIPILDKDAKTIQLLLSFNLK